MALCLGCVMGREWQGMQFYHTFIIAQDNLGTWVKAVVRLSLLETDVERCLLVNTILTFFIYSVNDYKLINVWS